MTATPQSQTNPEQRARYQAICREQLTGQYGAIGISAVAAAVRYVGVIKNPAYAQAPVPRQQRIELRFVEAVV